MRSVLSSTSRPRGPAQARDGLSRAPRAAIALLLSILLWMYVGSINSPNRPARLYPDIPVELRNLNESLVLIGTPPSVSIQIRVGDGAAVGTLLPTQPVAYVDLSGVGPGTRLVPVQLSGVSNAQVVGVDPPRVRLVLERTQTRTLPVTFGPSQATPGATVELSSTPSQVTVSGARTRIQNVKQVMAVVDPRQVVPGRSQTAPLQALDENGRPASGVRLIPSEVAVTLIPQPSPGPTP